MKFENRAESFRRELDALLKKYNTALEAYDEFTGYPECGQDIQICVDIENIWDYDGNIIAMGGEIKLGQYYNGRSR